MTKQELDQAEAVARAATQGDWEVDTYGDNKPIIISNVFRYGGSVGIIARAEGCFDIPTEEKWKNAEFIAHFNPEFCLKLIQRIRELEEYEWMYKDLSQ